MRVSDWSSDVCSSDHVGYERQPDNDLEGPRPQQQPHARSGQHADPEGQDDLHQRPSACADPCAAWGAGATPGVGSSTGAARWVRTDWWASAIRISTVAPTTSVKTPRSKMTALASGTLPTRGTSL